MRSKTMFSSSFLLSKSFPFLLLLLSFLHCNNPTTSVTLTAKSCSDTSKYATNSTFETNLNLLLSSLSSNFSSSGFNNASVGTSPDAVYGLFLCRGDVSPDTCRSCVSAAVQDIKDKCPNKKNATTWYDVCLLRYSETRFFSVMDNSSKVYKPNAVNVTNPTRFNTVLRAMLTNISSVATNSSLTKLLYASGEVTYRSTLMVYGLVQCTRDLSVNDCNGCLESAISDIPVCCNGSQGGRVLGKSCNLRFELYPFVEENSAPSGSVPTFPSPTSTTDITNSSSNSTTDDDGNKRTSARFIIAIVVPVVAGVASSIFIMYAYLRRRKNKKKAIIINQSKHQIGDVESLQFDLGTIVAATNNFSDANKLGQGGFGAVYKGKFSDGQEIAVKRLFRSSRQGLDEFKNEVVLVAKLQHKNLVRLLGCCLEGEEQILIFEYVPNESLEKFLFNPARPACLSWENRYKIIGGIAKGLLYLHEDSRLKIIHRDLKASNILLDGEMKPKISDFGTARLFEVGQTQGNTKHIAGTHGYLSPEYAMHGTFSIKSDVFSFGVLVLEIVTGRKSCGFYESGLAPDLPSYAWSHWNNETVMELIDATLSEICCIEEVIRCIHIGLLCVQEKVKDRPTMSSVVLMLNKDSVPLPPPLPPFFSNSNRGEESEHHTGSMTDDGSSGHCSSVPASTPSVCNSRDSMLIPITFGENGQPIGQEAAQLSSLIGRLVKTYVPPVYVAWTDVPSELKEKIWKEVSGTYTIDLIHRHHILQRANKLWNDWKYVLRRDHIYKYLTDAERKSHVPNYVKTEDWLRFVDVSSTEAALGASKVSRTARSKMKSPHTTGRKGCARVAAELKAHGPNEPVTCTDVFLATHKRKDGSTSSPEVDAIITARESDRSVVESDMDNDAVAKGNQTIGRGRSDQREQKGKKDRADKGKSKVTDDIDHAQWSDVMRKCLIDICLEQVKSGGRPGLQFSSKAWKMIIEKFTQRTGHSFNQEQLKNQLDNLKKLYNTWVHLTKQTGIGFNLHAGCVEMEQDRWTEYLKTYRDAKVFKFKPLSFPEEMAALFDGASTSNDAVNACIIDLAASVKAPNQLAIASTQSEGPTIDDCIDVLNAMPEISEASPLYLIALTCFMVKDKRTIWMRLRTDEGKMAWLKNQLQLEKGDASRSDSGL